MAVGSYHRVSSSESEPSQLDKISKNIRGLSLDDNHERKSVKGVRRFPPNGAPKALSDLLCPTGKPRYPPIGSCDTRLILYSTKRLDRTFDVPYQVVLINFDPWIRFPGLETMVLHPPSTHLTPREYEDELARAKQDKFQLSPDELDAKAAKREIKRSSMRQGNEAGEVRRPESPWFWTERAKYLDIQQGFQFS